MTSRRTVRTQALFITGATGFVGRRLLARLDPTRYHRVCCLTRTAAPSLERRARDLPIEIIRGSVNDASTYAASLSGIDVVVHLAAVTGSARARDYHRVNAEGTRTLLDHCARAGMPRFVFVSSIAATYRHTTGYHYAHSKQRAEDAVRQSGLAYVIVRPTMVFGRESAAWRGLARLVLGGVTPLFGRGTVKVQPIYVDDLVDSLRAMVDDRSLTRHVFDLGGPDTLTMEDLLRRIHQAFRATEPRVIHLPVRPLIAILSLVEPVARTALPVTAGQLAAFVNDSSTEPNPDLGPYIDRLHTLDEMLQLLHPHA